MALELVIKDWSIDNVANANFATERVLIDIDAGNSGAVTTACKLSATAGDLIGINMDKSKLDSNGTPVTNSGLEIRTLGIARVTVDGAISAGGYVGISAGTAGYGTALSPTASWQNKPVVGRALQTSSASGDQILVALMIGVRF